MVPVPDNDGNLPPGIHQATWDELYVAFGTTDHRKKLLDGLYRAARELKRAGCEVIYVDGSFVTAKDQPDDFDGCWDPKGVNGAILDPVLLDFRPGRIAQKVKYNGELFPSTWRAEAQPPHRTFLEFFQKDKNTDQPKGIIAIDLRRLP